jgi:MFS transporter, DHA2 family, multidrug resistance protein
LAQHVTAGTVPGIDLSAVDRLGELGIAGLYLIDGMINRQAMMIAYINDFWMMAILVGLCAPLIWLARNPPPLMLGKAPPPMVD